jgi:hypothetical protein
MFDSFAVPVVREMKAASSEQHKLTVETVCPDCGRRGSVRTNNLTRRNVNAGWLIRRFPSRDSLSQTC